MNEGRRIRLIAMDMDGTLTQHKTPLEAVGREALDRLRAAYDLVIVGAGGCERIHRQMGRYPIDIIGFYGMQTARYLEGKGLTVVEQHSVPMPDRAEIEALAAAIRHKYGLEAYRGDSVEFHASGMLTFALLGTEADIADKLAFDPQRAIRKPMYPDVCRAFAGYTVFLGGSSSFDIVPRPYDKLYALQHYMEAYGYGREEAVYFGDDYGPGGNDEQVYASDIKFIRVDDYRDFARLSGRLLADGTGE